MKRTVITGRGVSKAYRLGLAQSRMDFRETLMQTLRTPFKRMRKYSENWGESEDTFWALRDVNFEVQEGEVLGLIGRNGAGKSTLLKVLSRITEPTDGEIRMRGRVSSLLEVGTGFHPELTGRENIFLNGAILGMKRAEIKKKFDQIVEFAEVSQFLDTPVKRYSSGMYVRLAFSVAAHLDPEIMIVDEVLAVGDASFQKKCLGKMNDVVKQTGRTIIFVSHSMDAIAGLCTSVMLMKKGMAGERLTVEEGIKQYLGMVDENGNLPLVERARTQNKPRPPIFTGLTVSNGKQETNVISCGQPVTFEVEMENLKDPGDLQCAVALYNEKNQRVVLFHSLYQNNMTFRATADGKKKMACTVPSLALSPGEYHIELVVSDGYKELERVDRAGKMNVIFADYFGTGKLPKQRQSAILLPCQWRD
ncbi:MAG TPA: ABC transporter ATP-binding protein [Tepidisphaeraceae bacterium]|jgi:lipopolysaccharide transport system ATP-binding protein|nr:ABC transporter ATP-binding protein [Tepidisphaeraceae bacterium]